jgi:hypothetical protein
VAKIEDEPFGQSSGTTTRAFSHKAGVEGSVLLKFIVKCSFAHLSICPA